MRRLVVWIMISWMLLVGGLTKSAARVEQSPPQMLISTSDERTWTQSFFLLDPLTEEKSAVNPEQVRQLLREGRIFYDEQHDLYGWVMGTPHLPIWVVGVELVDIIAGEFLAEVSFKTQARPSPDWQWIVYLVANELYAVNLDERIPRNLFASYGLRYRDDYFAVAFSSDYESVFINATNAAGVAGLYRLRLDGTNEPNVTPIMEGIVFPLAWLSGPDVLLATHYSYGSDDDAPVGFIDLIWVGADGTSNGFLVQPEQIVKVYFEGWIPESNLLLMSFSHSLTRTVDFIEGWHYRGQFNQIWETSDWDTIGLTSNKQWIILAQGRQIARVSTDGSPFEIVAELPEGNYEYSYSGDGRYLLVEIYVPTTFTTQIWLVDMETPKAEMVDSVSLDDPESFAGIWPYSLSPDGQFFLYWKSAYANMMTHAALVDTQGNIIDVDILNGSQFIAWVIAD